MRTRLIVAVVSTALEETAIVLIWRWVLPGFGINLPLGVLVAAMVAWAIFSTATFLLTTRILKKQPVVGLPSMLGSKGKVASPLAPEGLVKIRGELWGAVSVDGNVAEGEEVEVVGEKGLRLVVRRVIKPTR